MIIKIPKTTHMLNKETQTLRVVIPFIFNMLLIAVRKKARKTTITTLKPKDKHILSINFNFLNKIKLNKYPGINNVNNSPKIILIMLNIILY